MDFSTVLDDVIVSLKPSDPYKVVLFGSRANGKFTEHSDIDLMVVLDNEYVSKTYQERLDKKVYIRKLLREINQKFALDLLVYSKAELEMVRAYGNPIIKEVEKTGRVIYEKVD